ncbi:MAG: DUF4340 domain-containing protein [Verrucomicrobiota bacterium]
MKNQTLIILCGVFLAMLAYLAFFGLEDPGTEESKEQAKKVMVFERESVDRLELVNPQESLLIAKSGETDWQIEKPVSYPADRSKVDSLLTELEFSERKVTIDTKKFADLQQAVKRMGLAEPRLELKLRSAKHAYVLAIGNETQRKGNFYAKLTRASRTEFIVIESALENSLAGKLDDWRSKKIFSFLTSDVTAINLTGKASDVEATKEGEDWLIKRPISGKTEPGQMNSFLSNLVSSRIQSFEGEDASDLAEYGLSDPHAVLEVNTNIGKEVLSIGNVTDENEDFRFARLAERKTVFTVPTSFVESVAGLLTKIREKRLLPLATSSITKVEIDSEDWNGVLDRSPDNQELWYFDQNNKEAADIRKVEDFLNALQNSRGDAFFERSDKNRKAFALDKPQYRIRLITQNEDSESKGMQLLISKAKSGKFYVESEFIDVIMEIPETAVPKTPRTSAEWYARKLSLPPVELWSSLRWQRKGIIDITLNKTAGGKWPDAWEGRKVDQSFLNRQTSLLSNLTILDRVKVPRETATNPTLKLTLASADETTELSFFPWADESKILLQRNGDAIEYLIRETDFKILELFPYRRDIEPDSKK